MLGNGSTALQCRELPCNVSKEQNVIGEVDNQNGAPASPERQDPSPRGAEDYFRNLVENTLDVVTILSGNGTIRYESPAIERVLGYRLDELIGRNVLELVHPDDR